MPEDFLFCQGTDYYLLTNRRVIIYGAMVSFLYLKTLYEKKIYWKQHWIHSWRRWHVLPKFATIRRSWTSSYMIIRFSSQNILQGTSLFCIWTCFYYTLAKHLADTNEAAHERMDLTAKQMAEQQGVNGYLNCIRITTIFYYRHWHSASVNLLIRPTLVSPLCFLL